MPSSSQVGITSFSKQRSIMEYSFCMTNKDVIAFSLQIRSAFTWDMPSATDLALCDEPPHDFDDPCRP